MEDNVVEFPPQETNTTEVKTPEKGVTTINQLRKKVKEIDIYSIPRDPDVDTGEGYKWSCFSKNEETGEFTLNEDSFTPYFNKKTDKMEYRLSLMKERVSRYGNDDFPDGLNRHHNDRIKFTGKEYGYNGFKVFMVHLTTPITVNVPSIPTVCEETSHMSNIPLIRVKIVSSKTFYVPPSTPRFPTIGMKSIRPRPLNSLL